MALSGLVAYLVVQSFIVTSIGLALGKTLGAKLGKFAKILVGAIFVVLGLVIINQTTSNRNYL